MIVVDTKTGWILTFDSRKRERTRVERSLDFADAGRVFAGVTVEFEDKRREYGETRIVCFGRLEGRTVVVVYVPRFASRRVVSMRKANEREKVRFETIVGI